MNATIEQKFANLLAKSKADTHLFVIGTMGEMTPEQARRQYRLKGASESSIVPHGSVSVKSEKLADFSDAIVMYNEDTESPLPTEGFDALSAEDRAKHAKTVAGFLNSMTIAAEKAIKDSSDLDESTVEWRTADFVNAVRAGLTVQADGFRALLLAEQISKESQETKSYLRAKIAGVGIGELGKDENSLLTINPDITDQDFNDLLAHFAESKRLIAKFYGIRKPEVRTRTKSESAPKPDAKRLSAFKPKSAAPPKIGSTSTPIPDLKQAQQIAAAANQRDKEKAQATASVNVPPSAPSGTSAPKRPSAKK